MATSVADVVGLVMTASLIESVRDVFGSGGLLEREIPGFRAREGQIVMASAVAKALEDEGHLVIEAATGIGKSMAYAVPAILRAVTAGKRVVFVTANIALQEQLVGKDLPTLARVLGGRWPFSFALLKGRSNFLCLERWETESRKGTLRLVDDPEDADALKGLLDWAGTTVTGDKSELPVEPPARLWRRFSVGADECLGKDCSMAEACWARRAKAAADDATVVVCNYHLLCAHLALKEETGVDNVLPSFDVVVCDEAHRMADVASGFWGVRTSIGSLSYVGRGLRDLGMEARKGQFEAKATAFFGALEAHRRSGAYKIRFRTPGAVACDGICKELRELCGIYAGAAKIKSGDQAVKLGKLADRCRILAGEIEDALGLVHADRVVFLETSERGPVLCSRSVDVSERLRDVLFRQVETAILTSATLAVDGGFRHVIDGLGVETADGEAPGELIVGSPFDYERRVLMVVPDGMPDPKDPGFSVAVGDVLVKVVEAAKGRTLGLFTSHRNLRLAAERLSGCGYRVLVQGEAPRTQLVAQFREDVSSVLLGTESFWEGVDVPGEALSCVVIDRLPFASPDDPVQDAVAEKDPKGWFMSYAVPRAIVSFKQGFGRLIRTVDDRGVVVVLDKRLVEKPYGRKFLASLPRTFRRRDLESIGRFLEWNDR